MAREIRLNQKEELESFQETLFRAIQSSHLNFLFGAGASHPGVATAGKVEAEITKLLEAGKGVEADRKTIQFLKQFAVPMAELLSDKFSKEVRETVEQYTKFIQIIDSILSERKTNLLPKQASIFTTNYDLFIERASEQCTSIILNDGFNRVPQLSGYPKFASERLFDATHHTGNLYDYTAELASINFVKLHGSFCWQKRANDLIYKITDFAALTGLKETDVAACSEFIKSAAIVLPTQYKHQQTIIERTYYDLLRIFANVMEREGSLLIAFGFSFRDEHIFEVIKRALRNPTLKLIIFCYSPEDVSAQKKQFASYNNVSLLIPATAGELNFAQLNQILSEVVTPKAAA
jgi:hypothetical protein